MKHLFKNKNLIIIYSILVFFVIGALANFIATSFYSIDFDISKTFYKGKQYDVIKGWSAYTIYDGSSILITAIMIFAAILLESLFAWFKKYKPNSWMGRMTNHMIWFYVLLIIVMNFAQIFQTYTTLFADHGFGFGFDYIIMIGLEYLIPIFVVSTILQNSYFIICSYFIRTNLSKRDDFLDNDYWKRTLEVLLMIAFIYIIILIVKPGMSRPYYFNIVYGNNLEELKTTDFNKWEHYMNQDKFNWGFIKVDEYGNEIGIDDYKNKGIWNIPGEWPWYKPVGYFTKQNEFYNGIVPWADAFPSGHIPATISSGLIIYIIGKPLLIKKTSKSKYVYILLTMSIIYILDMLFAMMVTSGHWWSDMMFAIVECFILFNLSYIIVNKGIVKLFNKICNKIKMNEQNRKNLR